MPILGTKVWGVPACPDVYLRYGDIWQGTSGVFSRNCSVNGYGSYPRNGFRTTPATSPHSGRRSEVHISSPQSATIHIL